MVVWFFLILDLFSYCFFFCFFRVHARGRFYSTKSTGGGEISTKTRAARPSPWARIAEEAEFPADYEA
ncbi:hypothetical protein ACVGXT_04220, partial [Enterobacter intestinihominis]